MTKPMNTPKFNQGYNSYGIANTTTLKVSAASSAISAIAGAYSGWASAKSQKIALSAQAFALRKQAQIRQLQNEKEQKYMNETAANSYWQLGRERDEVKGSQRSALSAQGFAGLQGGDAILTDTEEKYAIAQDMIARNLQINSFEANRQTAMDVSSLLSAANTALIQRSYISSGLNAFAGGASGAVQGYSMANNIMGGYGAGNLSRSSPDTSWMGNATNNAVNGFSSSSDFKIGSPKVSVTGSNYGAFTANNMFNNIVKGL